MSKLSSQPRKILMRIAEMLWETNFEYKNPWDEVDDNIDFVKKSAIWLGLDLDTDDMEFMAALMTENELLLDSKIKGQISTQDFISQLVLPKEEKFEIYYEVWGPATLTEKYKTTWKSYDKNWANDSLRSAWREGEWDYWDGDYQEYEADNFDADNFEVSEVYRIDESKKPILSKLIVENTKDMIENLDRETLIKIRNLINQKLSS